MKDYYKINEIAKLYGIGVDSLRYYERLGILKPRRDTNGYRLYSQMCIRDSTSDLGYACARGLFARKVLTAGTLVNAKTIRFEPAAVISEQDIQDVLSRMDEALAEIQA